MDVYPDYNTFIQDHPTGQPGDSFLVGTDLYIWDSVQGWRDLGDISGVRGATGAAGATGAQGAAGVGGIGGVTGDTGPIGDPGPTGATGPSSPFSRKSLEGDAGSHDVSLEFDPGIWRFSVYNSTARFYNISGVRRYFDAVRTNCYDSGGTFVEEVENNSNVAAGSYYTVQSSMSAGDQYHSRHWVEVMFRDITSDRLWYMRYWTSENEKATLIYFDRIY
jgi:hypothetical protein